VPRRRRRAALPLREAAGLAAVPGRMRLLDWPVVWAARRCGPPGRGGRGNIDGEPVPGSLATFIAGEVALLQPMRLILGHHDNWLPGFSIPTNTGPIRSAVAAVAPRVELGRWATARPTCCSPGWRKTGCQERASIMGPSSHPGPGAVITGAVSRAPPPTTARWRRSACAA